MGMIISIILVLALAAFLVVRTVKSKDNDLFKWIGIFILVTVLLTWILPYGFYQNGVYAEYGFRRLGISDFPYIVLSAINSNKCILTIFYLLSLGGFYGVISKTKGYQKVVNSLAKMVKKNEIVVSVILVVLFTLLSSLLSNTLVVLAFVPFVTSILLNAKFDKLTVMGITFGSILVGALGATYGTETLTELNYYLQADVKVGLNYRLIFGVIVLVLYSVFTALRVRKMTKNSKRSNDLESDPFAVETVKDQTKIWPTVVILSALLIFVILGYVDWSGIFGIECFNNFYTWLTDLSLRIDGEKYKIFAMILGENSKALGALSVTSLMNFLVLSSLVTALFNVRKMNETVKDFGNGMMQMIKPITLFVLVYVMYIFVSVCPFMTTFTNWIVGLTDKFNPITMTIAGFMNSVFNTEILLTSSTVVTGLTAMYASNLEIIHTIFLVTFGIVQLLIPTSGLLLVGLSYLKIDYKAWMKYIWIFAVAVIVVFLIFATVVTYWI